MKMMIRRINGRAGWETGNWNGYLGRHNIAFCYCEIKSPSWHFYIRGCAWRSYWHEQKDRKQTQVAGIIEMNIVIEIGKILY